ncbi:hypothetical protein BJY04DRAFT_135354 [Aspergillus karnatakaensis]|uniref:putative RING finger protein n=1 Tax=Aspergillus karnatakaensis TaxID=1810916 RepID=UPI003CCC98C3
MAEDSDEPSGATLGYLAPICVAVFFIFVCFRYRIIFGTRHRFRAPDRQFDPEGWPLEPLVSILTPADLDARFPLIKYSAWLATHKSEKSKNFEVDPAPGQEPISPSTRSFDATEKELTPSGKTLEIDTASSHGDAHMECVICMEDFDDDDSIRALTCRHIFHAACLDPWFTTRQARCPLCKTRYPPEPGSPSAPRRPAAVLLRNQIFPRVL